MPRGVYLVLAAIVMILAVAGLWLTPVVAKTRSGAWTVWVQTLGKWLDFGPLELANNVSEQITALQAENISLKAQLADYKRLREQLMAPDLSGYKQVSAEVAARALDPWQAQYVLNKGAKQGIVLNAPAVVNGSILVGFVSELHENASVLRLLFHPETSLPGDIMVHENLYRGLIRGKAFTAVELTSVPRDAPIEVGQDVVTASQDGQVPFGLVVGKIKEVADEPHDPFRAGRLEVPYDADRLRAVTVLTAP